MAAQLYYTTSDIFCKVRNYYVYLHPILTLYIWVLSGLPLCLTQNDPTFCPRSTFMCFMWISE